jgi:glycosyltransferase involved in cell wall biosynthesis
MPRDLITISGMRRNGVIVDEICDDAPGWGKYLRILKRFRKLEEKCDCVVIGYAGSVLVIFMRLFTRKKIVYNTLATFFDSMVISRKNGTVFSLVSLRYWLIDYLAFNLADISFLECLAQVEMVKKLYYVNSRKLSVHFVGADERQFYYDPSVTKLQQFTVVFRGAFLPEAGADVVLRAAKELEKENVRFRVIGRGLLLGDIKKLYRDLGLTNVELITEKLPIETLRRKMLECHLSLGQLADHPRVHTTVPHKAFESIAMRMPYLTGRNGGVMEVLRDGETCFSVPPGDFRSLARKIIQIRDNPGEMNRVAENARMLYVREFSNEILAKKMIGDIARL